MIPAPMIPAHSTGRLYRACDTRAVPGTAPKNGKKGFLTFQHQALSGELKQQHFLVTFFFISTF